MDNRRLDVCSVSGCQTFLVNKLENIMVHKLENIMLHVAFGLSVLLVSGCSSIVNDSHVPMTLSFSDNSAGECSLKNKRENYKTSMPATISVRRSDDALVFDCKTVDGRPASGSIPSEFGGMMAGNIILGGGIGALIDAESDKHRNYPLSFVIPVVAK